MREKKIPLPFTVRSPICALGSQTKNTLCYAAGDFASVSPMHGDLNILSDFRDFQKDARAILKKKPKSIAYDLHPEYQSTKYARKLKAEGFQLSACPAEGGSACGGSYPRRRRVRLRRKLAAVQHHHAHIASCMVDNGMTNRNVIGVAFDGTGMGDDGTLWGAEFFYPCSYKGFSRMAHLESIPLVGGEMAITQPWRLAAVWLRKLYTFDSFERSLSCMKKVGRNQWRVFEKMYVSGFNTPLASSMGRLFDAVACIVLGRGSADAEAELAVALERIALPPDEKKRAYPFIIRKEGTGYIIDPLPLMKSILFDLKTKKPAAELAGRFHLTIARMIVEVCALIRRQTGAKNVVLSGGVFQNRLLLTLSVRQLMQRDFKVYTHNHVSCTDSGLSVGQMAVANFRRH